MIVLLKFIKVDVMSNPIHQLIYVLFEEAENGNPDAPCIMSVHKTEEGAKDEMKKMREFNETNMWITAMLLNK